MFRVGSGADINTESNNCSLTGSRQTSQNSTVILMILDAYAGDATGCNSGTMVHGVKLLEYLRCNPSLNPAYGPDSYNYNLYSSTTRTHHTSVHTLWRT